jgi:hypothetical protein
MHPTGPRPSGLAAIAIIAVVTTAVHGGDRRRYNGPP